MSMENVNLTDEKKLSHIDPELVLQLAARPDVLVKLGDELVVEGFKTEKGPALLIHDYMKNNLDGGVSEFIAANTGLLADDILKVVQADLSASEDLLATRDLEKIKQNVTVIDYEGDKLILDQELQKDRDGKVEFIMVKDIKIGDKIGESVIVKTWKYGALKQLELPEGNLGNQMEFELFVCLKGGLNIAMPKETVSRDGVLVSKDTGVRLELVEGDVALLPIGVPRQIISNNPRTKYYTMGPAWGVDGGASSKPVYWPGQIS